MTTYHNRGTWHIPGDELVWFDSDGTQHVGVCVVGECHDPDTPDIRYVVAREHTPDPSDASLPSDTVVYSDGRTDGWGLPVHVVLTVGVSRYGGYRGE